MLLLWLTFAFIIFCFLFFSLLSSHFLSLLIARAFKHLLFCLVSHRRLSNQNTWNSCLSYKWTNDLISVFFGNCLLGAVCVLFNYIIIIIVQWKRKHWNVCMNLYRVTWCRSRKRQENKKRKTEINDSYSLRLY